MTANRVFVLGISGSARKGNSEALLDAALAGAKDAGAKIEKTLLNNLAIAPCQECGDCDTTGKCSIQDDMLVVFSKLRAADRIVIASPMFFSSLSAQLKTFIDRTHACWVERFKLNKPIHEANYPRKGLFIAVGAREEKENFQGAEKIIRVFFATQQIKLAQSLLFGGVEDTRDIERVKGAMDAAREAGRQLALYDQR